jgi:DNA-binding SARP family transcriptional activator
VPDSASSNETAGSTSPIDSDDGVLLPDGSWVPWALAAAISAAAAMVWLQRRRRYLPGLDSDAPTQLAPPVLQLQRVVTRPPDIDEAIDEAGRAAAVRHLPPLPPGGIGLVGDGAYAAARAALVTTLAAGGPERLEDRGEVVIDVATLHQVLGGVPGTHGLWPRLHLADDVEHALTLLESRLLHRSRILDEHALTDLDAVRAQAPDEEALPELLLICPAPSGHRRSRVRISLGLGLGLGANLRISALLLGEWEHGATIDVAADGHARQVAGPAVPLPPRLAVLEPEAATQILATLREAHTGLSASSEQAPLRPSANGHTDESGQHATSVPTVHSGLPDEPSADEPLRVALRVLGPPSIDGVTELGRALRAKARELAVLLACHPAGMATRDIGEYLEPDARLSQADQRVHTNASNLRHVLGRAGGPRRAGYLVKTAGRYRLNPAAVDVDLWQLRDLLHQAAVATGERRRQMLSAACHLYAPLADSHDYEWLAPHREAVRRLGVQAHVQLAEDLLSHDPQAASDLLDMTIGVDRYKEELYRRAMQARHAVGDTDGIRGLLRALSRALADLDAEPSEDTIALASQLRAALEHR